MMKLTMKDVMSANCQIPHAEMLTSNHCAALARELNKMLAAAPVSPAGEVEVLGYKFQFAGWVGTDGPQGWRLEFDTEKPAQFLFDDGRVKDFNELVDIAHVTRLTAENARLQDEVTTQYANRVAAVEERDALKAEVGQLKLNIGGLWADNQFAQADLTKARELLSEASFSMPFGWQARARKFLANQSAPAACMWTYSEDEFTWHTGCGQAWSFTEDGPKENGVKFCHSCGKPLEVAPAANFIACKVDESCEQDGQVNTVELTSDQYMVAPAAKGGSDE